MKRHYENLVNEMDLQLRKISSIVSEIKDTSGCRSNDLEKINNKLDDQLIELRSEINNKLKRFESNLENHSITRYV